MFKNSKIIAFTVIAVMLCGLLSFSVAAANPIVIDFSVSDDIADLFNPGAADGEYSIVTDGNSIVLFAEVVDGYQGGGYDETKGDPNAAIKDFAGYGVDGDVYQWMKMSVKNESGAPGFEIHFVSPSKSWSVENSITFDINPNSDYTEYIFNVPEFNKKYYPKRAEDVEDPDTFTDHWKGIISDFRLDFMYYEEKGGHALNGDKMYIEYIAFFDSEQAAKDFVFTPARGESKIQPVEEPAPAEDGDENNAAADNQNNSPAAGNDSEDGGNNMMMIIIIAAVVVVIVIIVIIVVAGKGKGKKTEE